MCAGFGLKRVWKAPPCLKLVGSMSIRARLSPQPASRVALSVRLLSLLPLLSLPSLISSEAFWDVVLLWRSATKTLETLGLSPVVLNFNLNSILFEDRTSWCAGTTRFSSLAHIARVVPSRWCGCSFGFGGEVDLGSGPSVGSFGLGFGFYGSCSRE